jgi:hypothetical protein
MIEPEENVEISVRIQNQGTSQARDVRAARGSTRMSSSSAKTPGNASNNLPLATSVKANSET